MAYDLYPAVDENYNFAPEVRAALAKTLELRNGIPPMTQTARNNLVGPELWDGRMIFNTDTDTINRYDIGTFTWVAVITIADMTAADNAVIADSRLHLGLRNAIRNGDMGVAQRGVGAFSVAGITLDGWKMNLTGGTFNVSQVSFGSTFPPFSYALHCVTAGQSAAGDFSQIDQRIEDVRTFAGKQVTLSFWANATVGTPKIGINVQQIFGTGGSPSAAVDVVISAIQIASAGMTRYSVTFTVPSIAGKTIGTNNDNYLRIIFWLSAGATFVVNASAIGIQNATIDIVGIQLEEGPVATPFERLPQQMQLAWCQRYFYRWDPPSIDYSAVGSAFNSSSAVYVKQHPVEMRATPTLIPPSNVATWNCYNPALVPSACGAVIQIGVPSPKSSAIQFGTAAIWTPGDAVIIGTSGTVRGPSTPIDFSAEL